MLRGKNIRTVINSIEIHRGLGEWSFLWSLLFLFKEYLVTWQNTSSFSLLDFLPFILKNILAHEELRNAQSSLKQSQETVKKLERSLSEKESQMLSVEETLRKTISELERQVRWYIIIQNVSWKMLLTSVKISLVNVLAASSACPWISTPLAESVWQRCTGWSKPSQLDALQRDQHLLMYANKSVLN